MRPRRRKYSARPNSDARSFGLLANSLEVLNLIAPAAADYTLLSTFSKLRTLVVHADCGEHIHFRSLSRLELTSLALSKENSAVLTKDESGEYQILTQYDVLNALSK